MDWDELAPLTDEQTQSIAELQQMMVKLSPIVHDIDKTKLESVDPSELSSLPSNHKLRERYKQIQLKQQQLLETKDGKYDDEDGDGDDDAYRYRQRPPKFDYIAYFMDQMKQQRNTPLQLTAKQQESWNYLTRNANYMRNVLDSISNLQNVMKDINNIYKENETKCAHIHNKCMHLIQQQKELEQESNKLREMVKYFADYNQIRARIFSPKLIDVLSKEFHNIVIRINECVAFLTTNGKQYKESAQYLENYQRLRTECTKLIKNYIQQRLNKVQAQQQHNNTHKNDHILEYRAAASLLRPLIQLIEQEAKCSASYARLLNELQKLILSERQSTLSKLVDGTISSYAATHDTANLIRASTCFVQMICLREYKLFNEFFDLHLTLKKSLLTTIAVAGKRRAFKTKSVSTSQSTSKSASKPTSPISEYAYISSADTHKKEMDDGLNIISGSQRIDSLIKDLCVLLYSYVRPFIIKTSCMQILCDIIHILQDEMDEHKEEFDSNITEFNKTIVRIIEDAQERLVFRTQIYLRDEIQKYVITDKDLAYFELLKEKEAESHERYSDWSPILEKTLSVLSKIYPVLNHSVFEFLAYEAVSCSVTSLVCLAQKLAHNSSSVAGHLFIVKHLLILREQISPFDVDFSITETTLDFGHMTQYLSDLLSSTSKYSLVEVFQHSIPSVNKHQLNSKKSMESVLKNGCESFIQTQTNLLIGPLISLISKYKQQVTIHKLRKQHQDNEEEIHPLAPISGDDKEKEMENEENAIYTDEEKEMLLNELNLTLDSLQKQLILRISDLTDLMKLYLQNELTQRILLKPIISNIQSAFIQLRKIVIQTKLTNHVKLNICDEISDKLQSIVNKNNR